MDLKKFLLWFLIVMFLMGGVAYLQMEYSKTVTPIIMAAIEIGLIIIGIACIKAIIGRTSKRADYIKQKASANRIIVSSGKKLPIYHIEVLKLFALALLGFCLFGSYYYFYSKFTIPLKDLIFPVVLYVVAVIYSLSQKDYILKNSLLFCLPELKEHFMVQGITEPPKRNFWKLSRWNWNGTLGSRRGDCEEICINHNGHTYYIGSSKAIYYDSRSSSDETRTRHVLCLAYIDVSVPYNFVPTIEMKFDHTYDLGNRYHQTSIHNSRYVISNYSNVPTIYCADTGYAERIVNENIQALLSELGKSLKNYKVKFEYDRITIELRKVLWSTWFMRTFRKRKATEDVINSIEKILDTMEKIVMETDRNPAVTEESSLSAERIEELKKHHDFFEAVKNL